MRRRTLKQRLSRLNTRLAVTLANLSRNIKFAILLTIDILMIPIAYGIVCLLSVGIMFDHPSIVITMTLTGGLASVLLGLPRIKLLTYEQTGIQRTAGYGVTAGLTGALISQIVSDAPIDSMMMLSITMAIMILSVSGRLLLRKLLVAIYNRGARRQRILIYGAGQTGVQLAAALDTDDAVEPIAFIDDNKTLQKVLVAGRPVHSPVGIQHIIEAQNIRRIVLAMPTLSRPKQVRLARHLKGYGCDVSTLPSFASLVGQRPIAESLQPADPASFLGREGLDTQLSDGCDIYADSNIMITGAGGSIGSELARQVISCQPKSLILFEVSEHALYQIDRELNDIPGVHETCKIIPVLGTVTDAVHVKRTMEQYDINAVLHAAAYKHVPMVEKNRLPSLYNNVIGTRAVAKAAYETGVSNFILVSTDKAVHPSNVMGASKRFAELIVQDFSTRSEDTRFAIVRFGNVLGSSGSVVPLFEEQIAHGGPVTLTHNEVTRYLMTISEAARLVLLSGSQAQTTNKQGQVYLLDMGDPVPIRKLAQQMIETAGYTVCDAQNPNGDIEITVRGLRPGEKLHEELAMKGHLFEKTDHPKINRVDEVRLSELEVASAVRALTDALAKGDEIEAVEMLERWISTPTHPVELAKPVVATTSN